MIGNNNMCLYIQCGFENSTEFRFYIQTKQIPLEHSFLSLDYTMNEKIFFQLLNKFFYDVIFKRYLGIDTEIEDFTIAHIPLLKMMTC